MNRKEIYQRAKDLLKRDGWMTGEWIAPPHEFAEKMRDAGFGGREQESAYEYGRLGRKASPNAKCPMCIEGAIYRAAGEAGIPIDKVRDALIQPLDDLSGDLHGVHAAMELNDLSLDPAPVLELLDTAIRKEVVTDDGA